MKKKLDIQYGPYPAPDNLLDLYWPDEGADAVFIFFHGGGLQNGSKQINEAALEFFTDRGIAVASANYRMYPVSEKGAKIRGQLPVNGGRTESVGLELDEDLTLLLRKGDEAQITLQANLPEHLNAPVKQGMQVGSVDVLLGGRVVAQVRVAASESVLRQSFMDGLRRVLLLWCFG